MALVCHELIIRTPATGGDSAEQLKAQQSCNQIEQVYQQFGAIKDGKEEFSKTYLTDKKMLLLYTKSSQKILQLVEPDSSGGFQYPTVFEQNLGSMEDAMHQMSQSFVKAAAVDLIDTPTFKLCRRKWNILKELSDGMHRRWSNENRVKPWDEIVDVIPEKSFSKILDQKKGNRFYWTLWLTVFAMTCNSATFALAYKYSSPEPGTARDADFWLLLQGSIMQWFSLLIAGSALWSKVTSPMWTWMVPTIVALVSSLVAIPLYLKVPTAWSAFLTTVGSAVQAFMTVQLAAIGQ
ncbi:hypothetical protein M409DRAFT_22063 [Zasmidium cellare ATCC 36951]|uniref:Uncharacterized protein n=1 Tax=Zasmidium cellare ATCC 36951 TaxID=1080233 RepID=A0A6A6CL03_ZASCE|nr:uncharacterized protein M409DRAFT_22063 [Zasmidium cellare ATCC 36951]KAF2167917.1 hypothetical protein M409DRAFT_22063 [Zasmidium cellare ATCC 36951]